MTYPSVISTENSREVSPLPKDLDRLRMPDHIAVIMDGNGRWAKARGLPRTIGHKAGVEALKTTSSNIETKVAQSRVNLVKNNDSKESLN